MLCRARVLRSLHPRELQSATYIAWRTQFAKQSIDDIQLRAIALGKTVVQRKDRPEAHALLVEVIPRARHLSTKGFRDLCIMANTASLHRECLKLFRARWEGRRDDASFVPLDAVIDAAFRLQDIDELLWLARLGADSLHRYSREVASDFALWRVVWRMACLCVSTGASAELRERAEASAASVWKDHIQRINPSLYNQVMSHITPYDTPSPQTGASNSASASPSSQQQRRVPQLVYTVLDVDMNSTMRKGFAGIFRRMQRIALYHRASVSYAGGDAGGGGDDAASTVTAVSSGGERADALPDDGEMHFFAFCKQYGLLRFNPRSFLEPPPLGAPPVNAGNVEQYYYSLVMTCRSGLYVEQAIRYSEEYRALLEERKKLDVAEAAASPTPSAAEGAIQHAPGSADEDVLPMIAKDGAEGEGSPIDPSPGVHQISESFFFQVLSVLQSARAHKLTLRLMGPIVSSTSEMSAALWSQILLAAGEEKQLSICQQGFQYAFHSLAQQHFPRGDSVSSMEYLLQTSMHAIAKCYVPNFMDTVIAPCLDNKLVSLNGETIAYLLTQNALHAPDAERAVEDARAWMRQNSVNMSTRIASLVMKILLRVESPAMISFYREMVEAAHNHSGGAGNSASAFGSGAGRGNHTGGGPSGVVVYKKIWLEELILCADRRRYFLTQEERQYILSEIDRVFGTFTIDPKTGKFSTAAMEGLRTQVAMLIHDARHDPLQTFLQWEADQGVDTNTITTTSTEAADGDGSDGPQAAGLSPPPILSDPRCYFLTRQPHCCLRWKEIPLWYARLFPGTAKYEGRACDNAVLPVTARRARRESATRCLHDQLSAEAAVPQTIGVTGDGGGVAHDIAYRALLASIVEQSQLEDLSAL